MRTPYHPRRLTARSAGIGMAGLLVAGLAAVAGPTLAAAQAGTGSPAMAGMHMSVGVSPSCVGNTLQCPTAKHSVDPPHRIDLSRVFGSGTENALLPAHRHIVTSQAPRSAANPNTTDNIPTNLFLAFGVENK